MTGSQPPTPIHRVSYRQRVQVSGRVETVSVEPFSGVPTVECRLVDGSGTIILVFLGRRKVPGVTPGVSLSVEGMVGRHRGLLAIINPDFTVIARSNAGETAS